jgi:hypothetical protein
MKTKRFVYKCNSEINNCCGGKCKLIMDMPICNVECSVSVFPCPINSTTIASGFFPLKLKKGGEKSK